MPVRGARLALGAELGGYRIDELIGQGRAIVKSCG